MKEGWLCPRCGKVNAPFVGQCSCNNKKYRQNYRKPCSHDWVFDDMDDSGTCFYHCSICGSTNTIKGPLGSIKI